MILFLELPIGMPKRSKKGHFDCLISANHFCDILCKRLGEKCINTSHFLQSLTTWDSGNQLTYPVKYIGIGYDDHQGPKDDEAEETGYSVKSDKDSDVIDYPQKDSPDV